MKKLFFILFLLAPYFLLAQSNEKNMGFIGEVGYLSRLGGIHHLNYELGAYTYVGERYLFLTYGNEQYSYLRIGAGGSVNEKIKLTFSFIFYVNAGLYENTLPKHFGGSATAMLKTGLTPFIRLSITTLEPALLFGLRYQLGFIE